MRSRVQFSLSLQLKALPATAGGLFVVKQPPRNRCRQAAILVVQKSGDVVAVKVDDDVHRYLVRKYKVNGYPKIILIGPEGVEIRRVVGSQSVKEVVEFLSLRKSIFGQIPPTFCGTYQQPSEQGQGWRLPQADQPSQGCMQGVFRCSPELLLPLPCLQDAALQ